MNVEAYAKLQTAEEEYLRANGWTAIGEDEWTHPEHQWRDQHPDDAPRKFRKGHAVNRQKFFDAAGLR